jgi:SAM-dependent methyltransferase
MDARAMEWDDRYRAGDTPWDEGLPAEELAPLVAQRVARGNVLEVGCGTGTNAVFLAKAGLTVTACDIAWTALVRARERAHAAGVEVKFVKADLIGEAEPDLGGPFDFVFDRGTYHVLRRVGAGPWLRRLAALTRPGAMLLVQTGNANDPGDVGPPRVHAHELCAELRPWWDLVRLEEIRWTITIDGASHPVLAWSGLFRRADEKVANPSRVE